MSDVELLHAYARNASEEAFRALVARHADLVYAAALRQVRDAHLAEEISQTVFTLLAQKAHSLTDVQNLAGWLHRATCLTALKAIRSETRRRRREQEATLMREPAQESEREEEVLSVLDQAVDELSEPDRLLVLGRFFERKTSAEMGLALQISEEAAKKRITRAIEKLRVVLQRRRIAISTGALAALLLNLPSAAAPASLALNAAAGASAAAKFMFLGPLMTAKSKLAIAACILALCGITAVRLQRQSKIIAESISSTSTNSPGSRMQTLAVRLPARRATVANESIPPASAEINFDALALQLNAALRASSQGPEILNRATIDAVRAFGSHHDPAFACLTNAIASPERLVFSRAIEALELLDKETPGLLPFLWQTAASGHDRGQYAITPLINLGLEPSDLPKLAELLPIRFLNSQLVHASEMAIQANPEEAKAYLPAFENFLSHENSEARFYAACILAKAGEAANPRVIAEICGALDGTSSVQIGHGLRALQSAGPSAAGAIPALLKLLDRWTPNFLEDEIVMDAPQKLRMQMLRTIGAIDPALRSTNPELNQLLSAEEKAAAFQDMLSRGGGSAQELIVALNEPAQRDEAVFHLQQMGPTATDALPKLMELLSSTYEKSRKDEIEAAILAINPQLRIRHIDADKLGEAFDAIESAMKNPETPQDKAFVAEISKRHLGLINQFTWYTEENLRDLSKAIAAKNPAAHQVFKSKLLSSDPSVDILLQ